MGKKQGLPEKLPEEHRRAFPNLKDSHEVTSDLDVKYNCIAFAAGDVTKVWDPNMLPEDGYHWPSAALRDNDNDDLEALKRCFAEVGYEECDNGNLESGYRKIALYAIKKSNWKHAAIQDENGKWKSKLGLGYDICHDTPECVNSPIYGTVMCYMRKKTVEVIHEEIETKDSSSEAKDVARTQEPPTAHPA
jgi:hypothetical protein